MRELSKFLECFNPCSNGWCTSSMTKEQREALLKNGFNPCSNGWCTSSLTKQQTRPRSRTVSILVLMDGVLRAESSDVPDVKSQDVSILVLMDGVLRVSSLPSVLSGGGVSILVLMDGVLRAFDPQYFHFCLLLFQSLF